MIPEGIPGQLCNEPVILVCVFAVMRKNQVGGDSFQALERSLNFRSVKGKESIPKVIDDDFLLLGMFQKKFRADPGFPFALFAGAKHDPNDFHVMVSGKQPQNGPTATNLDVVRV